MASSTVRLNNTHVGLPIGDEVDPEYVPHGLPGWVQLIQDKGPTVWTQNLQNRKILVRNDYMQQMLPRNTNPH